MKLNTKQVELRILQASKGNDIVSKKDLNRERATTEDEESFVATRSKTVYLAKEATPEDFTEVPEL